MTLPERPAEVARRDRAIAATDALRELLELTEESVARIVGLSRGTLRSWRSGDRIPYPATTRRLFEIDSTLRALIGVVGRAATVQWLHDTTEGGEVRLDLLSYADGPKRIARDARTILFTRPSARLLPDPDQLDEEASDA